MTDVSDPVAGAVSVAARLAAIEGALADVAAELVPERVPGHQLARVVRSLGRIERRTGGARLVLTKAAADLGAWRGQGYRSPEEWAARANGTSTAQAKADLRASEQLAALPAARAALGTGEISPEAAKAVAEGATADPAAEGELLGSARTGDLSATRDEARRARQRAEERDGTAAEKMHRRRGLRTWLELDGEGRGSWNVPPAHQARFLAALEPYRQEAFRLARESGRRETPEALMADALDLLARDTLADLHIPDPTTSEVDAPEAHAETDGPGDAVGSRGPDSDPRREAGQGHGAVAGSDPGTHPGTGVRETSGAGTGPRDDHPAPMAGDPGTDPCCEHPADTLFGPSMEPEGDPGPEARAGTGGSAEPPGPTTGTTRPSDRPDPRLPRPPGSSRRRFSEKPKGAGNRRAPAQLVVHATYDALVRGYPLDGEVCEIPGLGPVPVAFARFLATDCLLKVVLTGTDVTVIASDRRYVPAALRTALDARDTECVAPGCHATHHLERDHWGRDFAKGGPTSLANLCRICSYHHYLKTHCGWQLTGGPGHWRFEPPP